LKIPCGPDQSRQGMPSLLRFKTLKKD